MNDRLLSLLGLCRRAGKLVIGADPSVESILAHKSKIIIAASDFSKNSAKAVLETAHKNNVRVFNINRTKDEISFAVGKLCGVISIEDEGFAKKFAEIINNEQGGELYG